MRKSTAVFLCALIAVASPLATADEPEPYDPDEFPPFMRDIRRFEIISLGSIPITLLFSSLSYRLYRLAAEDEISWFETGQFDQVGRRRVLTVSFGLSAAVGLADFILGRREQKSSEYQNESTR